MNHKNTVNHALDCKGRHLDLDDPKVMGIVNVTPDSFYDGGKHLSITAAVEHALKMHEHGAAIIDIGGQSTKPNAEVITSAEEQDRVLPVIEALANYNPKIIISVDTYYADVAKHAVLAGASIVNDVSAGTLDATMLQTVADLRVPYIAMHMQGTPQNMQINPHYNNVCEEVFTYLNNKISACKALGIAQVIVDVGFGFGKTVEHNYQLLNNLETFQKLETPLLVGISRKSMLYKLLNITAQESLNATTAANMLALTKGAHILRVHDVKEAIETIKIFLETRNA